MERIEELLRRPTSYNNIDGVAELAMGFMGIGFFVLIWMQWHSSPLSLWHSIWTLFAYIGLMCVIIHFGTKAIKERITYPRTGFISYRRSKAVWATIVAAPAAALTTLAILALRKTAMDTSIPIFLAGSLFLTSGYAFRVAREVQWKWIVAAVMAMSHALGTTVVGEGIETSDQLDALTGLDCDQGQGFLFARPMSAEALTGLLQLPGRILPEPEPSQAVIS